MKEIVFEDGLISLNGQEVPGILRSLSVEGKVRFDEHKVDGMSGKKKMPVGYEDCDISASLYLCTDDSSDCYDKLETLAQMFRDTDPNANPQIYEVSSRHIGLRGIRQVVFSRLSTSENDKSDEIVATLGFVEHRPPIVKVEQAMARSMSSMSPLELARAAARKVVNEATGGKVAPQEDKIIIDMK